MAGIPAIFTFNREGLTNQEIGERIMQIRRTITIIDNFPDGRLTEGQKIAHVIMTFQKQFTGESLIATPETN